MEGKRRLTQSTAESERGSQAGERRQRREQERAEVGRGNGGGSVRAGSFEE